MLKHNVWRSYMSPVEMIPHGKGFRSVRTIVDGRVTNDTMLAINVAALAVERLYKKS